MKLKTILSTLVILAALSVAAFAQEKAHDAIKLSASFVNSDLSLDDRQGFSGEIDGRLYKGRGFRIGGVAQWARVCSDCRPRADIISAGPQVSYGLFGGRIEPFGRALFGVTTDYNGLNRFTRTYGFGGDVNFGHFFVRPFVIDFRRVEGARVTVHQYSAGAGFRF